MPISKPRQLCSGGRWSDQRLIVFQVNAFLCTLTDFVQGMIYYVNEGVSRGASELGGSHTVS